MNRFFKLIIVLVVVLLSSCGRKEVRFPVKVASGTDYRESIELAKKINQKEEIQFRDYSETNKITFERSNYGFQYTLNNLDSILIKSGDLVWFDYIVENLNGQVIYEKRNKSLLIDQQEEIKGLHEGLKLMSKGASAIFLFPSHQAFGYHGDEDKIGSNTPLLYRVEVLNVEQKNN